MDDEDYGGKAARAADDGFAVLVLMLLVIMGAIIWFT